MKKDSGQLITLFILTLLIVSLSSPSLSAEPKEVPLAYGDLVLDKTAASMRKGKVEAVVFPHWFHRIRFRCKVCHEDIFTTKKGADEITMDAISKGKSCGVCHDNTIAWDPLFCERCHFYPLRDKDEPSAQKNAERKEGLIVIDPSNPMSAVYAGRDGQIAGTGDPRLKIQGAFKWTAGWQPRALSLEGLPKDKFGLLDWIKMTRENLIFPKGARDPEDPMYESPVHFEYVAEGEKDVEDILIEVKSDYVSAVVFPHTLHAWWLNCKSCHPKRFTRTAGDTVMTMREMADGKYCGECHGKVAFPLQDCERCHDKEKVEKCKKNEDSCISD